MTADIGDGWAARARSAEHYASLLAHENAELRLELVGARAAGAEAARSYSRVTKVLKLAVARRCWWCRLRLTPRRR